MSPAINRNERIALIHIGSKQCISIQLSLTIIILVFVEQWERNSVSNIGQALHPNDSFTLVGVSIPNDLNWHGHAARNKLGFLSDCTRILQLPFS